MAIPLNLSEVPNLTPYIQYVSGSGQTVFPYPFPITQDSDLVVVINGVTLNTDSGYSLSGQGNDTGGNVTFALGQTVGAIVTLYRDVAIQRITQIGQNSGFSSTAFNAEFNNLYLIAQQLKTQIAQCLQIPNTNNPAPVTTLTPAAYANKYQAYDQYGNPTPAVLTTSGSITQGIIANLLNPATLAEGAAGVTVVNTAVPAYPINPLRYGTNTVQGTTDMTVALQACASVAAQTAQFPGGAAIYIPGGNYFHSAPITLSQGTEVYGDGYNGTVLSKTSDIETFNTPTGSSMIGLTIRDLSIVNNLATATAKYDIHLTNVSFGRIVRVNITNTGSIPTSYSSTNTGGIYFSNNAGTSECNWVEQCFIQNNSIWFGPSCTDSIINNCIVWGSNRNFAIRIDSGNITVSNCPDLVGSQYNGTVYVTSTATLPRIENNFFDGGQPGLTTGVGLNVAFCNLGICSGNMFFNLWQQGVVLFDSSWWNFQGNTYQNCNRANNSWDDVLIEGAVNGASGNRFTNEVHLNNGATSKGWAYDEVNGGVAPGPNTFIACVVDSSATGYQSNSQTLNKPAGSASGTMQNVREGVFTPVLAGSGTGGSNTYSAQSGTYKQLGNICFFDLTITTTAVSGMTGNLIVTGLPFPVALSNAPCAIGPYFGISGTYASLMASASSGSNNIGLYTSQTGQTSALAVSTTGAANATSINLSGFYFIQTG